MTKSCYITGSKWRQRSTYQGSFEYNGCFSVQVILC